jgi:hypothetical protein
MVYVEGYTRRSRKTGKIYPVRSHSRFVKAGKKSKIDPVAFFKKVYGEGWKRTPKLKAPSESYEGFRTDTTGFSYYDDMLEKPEYFRHSEGLNVEIIEMTPMKYMQEIAKFQKVTIEHQLAQADTRTSKIYAEDMKRGSKFPLPFLNYADKGQEGRHRVFAAMLVGIKKIPVLTIRPV